MVELDFVCFVNVETVIEVTSVVCVHRCLYVVVELDFVCFVNVETL